MSVIISKGLRKFQQISKFCLEGINVMFQPIMFQIVLK